MMRRSLTVWRGRPLADSTWLEWRGRDGVLHREFEGGTHPLTAYRRMVERGAAVAQHHKAALMQQCHHRLPWSLFRRKVDEHDVTSEIVPSCRLFETLITTHSPTDRINATKMKQSHFRYLCRAKLPQEADRVREQYGLVLSLPCYTFYLSALAANSSQGGTEGGVSASVVGTYRELRTLIFARSLLTPRAAHNAANIHLIMLRHALQHGNEVSAFDFFAAHCIAKALEARLLGHNPPTDEACLAELEFPDWQEATYMDGNPRVPLLERLSPCGPNIAVQAEAYVLLMRACSTLERAHDVLRVALEQSCPGAPVLRTYLHLCNEAGGEEAVRYAARGMSAVDSTTEAPMVGFGGCWALYMHVLSTHGVPTHCPSEHAGDNTGVAGEAYERAIELAQDAMLNFSQRGVELTPDDAVKIARSLAHMTRGTAVTWCADVAGFFDACLERCRTPRTQDVARYLDKVRLGTALPADADKGLLLRSQSSGATTVRRPAHGVNLGDREHRSARSEGPKGDMRWERAQTYGAITDAVEVGGDRTGPSSVRGHSLDQPPWEGIVRQAADNFNSPVPIFTYVFAGSRRQHYAGVAGQHPHVSLQAVLKRMGETPGIRAAVYTSAGDEGVAALIQISRLRLIYALSVTLLGGFNDVVQREVGYTQALFREAGSLGAASRWAWRSMQMYEDEVDDIIRDNGIETPSLYVRLTATDHAPMR